MEKGITGDMIYLEYDKKVENTTVGMPELKYTDDDSNSDESSEDEREPLSDDVYAFLFVAPVFSKPFVFAAYTIMVKYVVFGILASGIRLSDAGNIDVDNVMLQAVKFFLIPVAIAMQEDLINVYAGVANLMYDEEVLNVSENATEKKLIFSYVARFFDGILSLGVNFAVMLVTNEILGVFLNFAALHFLQSIDDVFFALVVKGFFGDEMEHMSHICESISFPLRKSDSGCVKVLDSLLFFVTLSVCVAVYAAVFVYLNSFD